MRDKINLAFVHDSLPIFGIGSSQNIWIHELATIGTNALCRRADRNRLLILFPKSLAQKYLQGKIFAVVKYVPYFFGRNRFLEKKKKNTLLIDCWISILYTTMYRWIYHLGAN